MSIRSGIIAVVIFLLALMALGVLAALRPYLTARTEADFLRYAEGQVRHVEDLATSRLRNGEEAATALASLPETLAAARRRAPAEAVPSLSPVADDADLIRHLAAVVALVPGTEGAFFFFADGSSLTASGGSAAGYGPDWYSAAAYAPRPGTLTNLRISTTGKGLAGTVSARIRDEEGEVLGVAGLELSLSALMDTLGDIRPGRGGYLLLFDSSGRVLRDPMAQENLLRPSADLAEESLRTLARQPEGRATLTRNGVNYTVFVRSLAGSGWKAALLMDTAELNGQATAGFFWPALGLGGALCVLAGAGAVFAIRLTRPLEAVIRQSAALAEGKDEALAAVAGRGPDIAALHASLGALMGRVMLLTRSEREKAAAVENHGKLAHAAHLRAEAADKAALVVRTRADQVEAVRRAASCVAPLTTELASAVTLAAAEHQQATAATADMAAALAAMEELAVHLESAVPTLARRADEVAAGLPLLAKPVRAGAVLARDADRAVQDAADLTARLPESLAPCKEFAGETAGTALALRDLAGSLNMTGLTAAIEAAGAGEAGASLTAASTTVRALAERAMTLAARMDAATTAFDQAHAAHSLAMGKALAAVQRAVPLAEKAARTAALADSGTTVLAGQVLALEKACNEAAPHDENTPRAPLVPALAAVRSTATKTRSHLGTAMAAMDKAARLAQTIREMTQTLGTDPPSGPDEKALD